MMEVENHLDYEAKPSRPVDRRDLKNVEQIFNDGYLTIAMCSHGIGRSYKYASEMARRGHPTAFLEGGLQGLSKLNSKRRKEAIKAIKRFPNRDILLHSREIKEYADLISRIGGCIINCDYEAE